MMGCGKADAEERVSIRSPRESVDEPWIQTTGANAASLTQLSAF